MSEKASEKMDVIVVDDSRSLRHQLRIALVEAGYGVIEAADGCDGLEKIRDNPEARLVICDINMPRMNGVDLVEAVKAQGGREDLPILIMTSDGQSELIAQARNAGAQGWIMKPFNPNLLIATVNKMVKR